jgi:hypothetical protein
MMSKPPRSTPGKKRNVGLERRAKQYLDLHRGRKAIQPAPPAGWAAARILRPLARRFGPGVEQLKAHWSEIVGTRLADWSSPETLQRQSGINVLVIRARGPAGAIIQAESRRILERVRTYAGAQAPTRIRIVQGRVHSTPNPSSPAKITKPPSASNVSEGVEQSAEARLLSALDRFGQQVKARNNI